MSHTAGRVAKAIELLARDVLTELKDVPEAILNRPVQMPEANSLFAIATHLVGAGEAWTLGFVGGRTIQRDRAAEFHATGKYADIDQRYERWIADLHDTLDTLPDSELGRPTTAPVYREGLDAEVMLVGDVLVHALEHTALHLGHVQITKQVLMTMEHAASL